MNRGIMLLDIRPVMWLFAFINRRRQARELRQKQAHEWMQDRLQAGEAGILRAKLAAKQRANPLSVDEYPLPLDRDGILACAAFYLDKDEDPRPSLDALERQTGV